MERSQLLKEIFDTQSEFNAKMATLMQKLMELPPVETQKVKRERTLSSRRVSHGPPRAPFTLEELAKLKQFKELSTPEIIAKFGKAGEIAKRQHDCLSAYASAKLPLGSRPKRPREFEGWGMWRRWGGRRGNNNACWKDFDIILFGSHVIHR